MSVPRKARLLGFFVPLAGLLLIMPPMVHVFGAPREVLGVPAIIAFLFTVWIGLIVAAFFLQGSLSSDPKIDANGPNSDIGRANPDKSEAEGKPTEVTAP